MLSREAVPRGTTRANGATEGATGVGTAAPGDAGDVLLVGACTALPPPADAAALPPR